jgi:hypothetical protein
MLKALCVVVGSLFLVPSARAQDRRLLNLERELALAKSPAVRARAAGALARTDDEEAVGPLCKALATDADGAVRAAVAQALGKLGGEAAFGCLKARVDPVPEARAAVAAALETLRAAREEPPTRYVALLPLDAAHNALGPEAGALALRQLRHVLERRGARVDAKPRGPAQVRALLRTQKLEGFALKLSLDQTEGGGVSLDLLCTHYPTGGLIGDVTVKAKGGAVADLIRALVPRALDEAESTCGWRVE